MYFSAKGEYGIMAVLDLALANGSAPVQAKAIADRQGIPLRFLEHILSALKHAGLQGQYTIGQPMNFDPQCVSVVIWWTSWWSVWRTTTPRNGLKPGNNGNVNG